MKLKQLMFNGDFKNSMNRFLIDLQFILIVIGSFYLIKQH